MSERLYTDFPELYDVIQSEYDYDRDLAFIQEIVDGYEGSIESVLEIGCGTGEHTCRLDKAGFEVTAVDKHEPMLAVARGKCNADFRQTSLPTFELDSTFEMVVAIRGVVNHLLPDEIEPALSAIKAHLNREGIVLFDNAPLPEDGNEVGLDVGSSDRGDYARLAQHVATGEGYLEWRSVMFGPEGEFFVNSRPMTPFEDDHLRSILETLGFEVETHEGFGSQDSRTVFVARR